MRRLRVTIGVLVAPLVLVVVWTIPYLEHPALYKWIFSNVLTAYTTFILTAFICHVILRLWKSDKAWQYGAVMFCVAFISYVAYSFYVLQGYSQLFYSQTQVIEGGSFTKAGVMLQITDSLKGAALLTISFWVFWLVAVWSFADKKI